MNMTIKFEVGKKGNDFVLPSAQLRVDVVRIRSDVHPDYLQAALPMQELGRLTHSFTVEPMKKSRARLCGNFRSVTEFVHPHTKEFCDLLATCIPCFGAYSITGLEMCIDFPFDTRDEAERGLEFIQKHLCKRWHRRDFIERVYKGKRQPKKPDKGYINVATVYTDDRKCRTAQKSYARNPKIPGGTDLTKFIVRIEWSLKNKSTIAEKTGIKQIQDLLTLGVPIPKGEEFVSKYFRLMEVDLEELGKLFAPRYRSNRRKDAWPRTTKQKRHHDHIFPNGEEAHYYRRVGSIHLKAGAWDELKLLVNPDAEEIEQVCSKWESTAQAKVYVRNETKKAKAALAKAMIKARKETKAEALAEAGARNKAKNDAKTEVLATDKETAKANTKVGAKKKTRGKVVGKTEARAMTKLGEHAQRMLAITRHFTKKCFPDVTHKVASVVTCRSPGHDDSDEDEG